MKLRVTVVAALLCGALFAASERREAEWVIRQGGRVFIVGNTQPISELSALPKAEPIMLSVVDLYGTIIEPKELEQISRLTQIKELYLPGPSWSPGAGSRVDANEELKFLSTLRTLEKLHFSLHFLTNVNVQDKGLKHLESLTHLKELRLAQGRIRNFSLASFAELEGLDLSYTTATDDVLKSLSGLKNLRRLNLRDTLVTDAGLAHLANVSTLEELDLFGLKIGDIGIAHLKRLRELRKLNLLGGPVTDAGADVLAGLPKLRELNLYRAEITNAGVSKLSALRELAFLDLRYTKATASGVDKLRGALPKCKIAFSGGARVAKALAPPPSAGAGEAMIGRWISDSLHGKVEWNAGRIYAITLARSEVNDSHLSLIAGLDALEDLDLEATEIGDLGLAALSKLSSLKRLRLGATTVSDRGLGLLSGLKQLQLLSVSGTLVRTLATLPESLVELDVSSTSLQPEALPKLTRLPALAKLNFAYTDLTDSNIGQLGRLASLRSLDLTGTDIGDAGLEQIAKLTQLEELRLNHGRFTEKGFAHLVTLRNLRQLEAVRTRLGGEAAETIAQLKNLEQLNLDYTSFNNEGLKLLVGLPLTALRLDSANISDEAVDSLIAMRSLKTLNLYHTLVSEEAHARLVKGLPNTKIVWDRDSKLPNRRGS